MEPRLAEKVETLPNSETQSVARWEPWPRTLRLQVRETVIAARGLKRTCPDLGSGRICLSMATMQSGKAQFSFFAVTSLGGQANQEEGIMTVPSARTEPASRLRAAKISSFSHRLIME